MLGARKSKALTVAGFAMFAGAVAAAGRSASGAVITVSQTQLYANTANQIIEVDVSGSDLVTGVNFYAQIGDGGSNNGATNGTTTGPTITNTALTSAGEVFAGGTQALTFPDSNHVESAYSANTTGGTVTANGVLAYLTVDTTGYSAGQSFTVSFADFSNPTNVYETSFAPAVTTTMPGDGAPVATINLVAVPEPASLGICGIAATGLLARRSKRRSA